ncbi:hypothetical protein CYMTET_23517 [Cymbomonas tetramitiformis]|uniref:Uncharacterized protein n=1 Tax=Cymbomonas tetramitiformis TaxID=36881 RepID=A0AAE0FXP6_9CHLO|nr:hypothetical protein CYMTET_23517 [Cymbomonas tetramitiformis]
MGGADFFEELGRKEGAPFEVQEAGRKGGANLFEVQSQLREWTNLFEESVSSRKGGADFLRELGVWEGQNCLRAGRKGGADFFEVQEAGRKEGQTFLRLFEVEPGRKGGADFLRGWFREPADLICWPVACSVVRPATRDLLNKYDLEMTRNATVSGSIEAHMGYASVYRDVKPLGDYPKLCCVRAVA